ncbi:OB-fold domain-containing protein [Nonomuraea sp. NBC_01738]|uniref:Zn-ribbon domain-containing OB-fold protein n=1 Tax=Nonomuraea sp. NBC_01738 TaxID=2976003 RepID=UPI002E143811|nr:OB-fold domain-containing protein [Nonomuraea sp. NBC_01738]
MDELWWQAAAEERLLLQSCLDCGHRQHYPRALCTSCGGEDLGWSRAGGGGTVDAFTTVHRAPDPELAVPYVIARVRLDEGPILLTRLIGDEPWTCDERVRLTWWRGMPAFEKE